MDLLREHRYLVLFLALIVVLGVQPLAHGHVVGQVLFDVLVSLLLLVVFLVVFERRWQRVVALVPTVAALAGNWATYAWHGEAHRVAVLLFHSGVAAFFAFAVVVILHGIFSKKVIRGDDVFGGLCGYLLGGAVWGNLYVIVEFLVPGSFSVQPEVAWQLTTPHLRRFLFTSFSLATISSLGSNVLVPVGPVASWLVCLEAIFGQFYVAVVVAQVLGLKLAQAARADNSKEDSPGLSGGRH
jgi:hypothetical protein